MEEWLKGARRGGVWLWLEGPGVRREERLWCAGAIGLAEGVAEGRGGVEEGWRKIFGAGVVGRGWRAGGWLEGSSYLIPDVVIVGGRMPCFAEVV